MNVKHTVHAHSYVPCTPDGTPVATEAGVA